ncbi:MAG: DNA cytosine methyltransferase [Rhodocyclaceae bacterium]|nr:DNA cytosine methyltransferase [Rhodocyclaceae bacterium]
MRVAGLFAGIGGLELGFRLADASYEAKLLCDVLPQAKEVLTEKFAEVDYHDDVTSLRDLPAGIDCLTAGFPCQDLSQAGRTAGLDGSKSSLIAEVFRLLDRQRIPIVVIENVPFMLQLGGGRAMRAIVEEFERLGYRWAYRVVDTLGFGLPQRRERVFLLASVALDPSTVLLTDDALMPRPKTSLGALAHGFYWTEGLGGLGWAVDAVPTLKNGSTLGIASPPAVLMPNGQIVRPSIEDGEALQGFPRGWTKAAEKVAKAGYRWGLVGSAVSVPVAKWIGSRLVSPVRHQELSVDQKLNFPETGKCPRAAAYDGKSRFAVAVSSDPIGLRSPPLENFLQGPLQPLSARATAGFYSRTKRAKLRFEPGFIEAVRNHLRAMGGNPDQDVVQGKLDLAA